MDIQTYLKNNPEKRRALAQEMDIGIANIYQWMRGLRPVPVERCAVIERLTQGAVTRKDLRPNDWQEIWPELAANAPSQPQPQTPPESNSTPAD